MLPVFTCIVRPHGNVAVLLFAGGVPGENILENFRRCEEKFWIMLVAISRYQETSLGNRHCPRDGFPRQAWMSRMISTPRWSAGSAADRRSTSSLLDTSSSADGPASSRAAPPRRPPGERIQPSPPEVRKLC